MSLARLDARRVLVTLASLILVACSTVPARTRTPIDRATAKPRHDPATLETDVPGLFVAGSTAAGNETSKIFIETGRFHGEAIVKAIQARRA